MAARLAERVKALDRKTTQTAVGGNLFAVGAKPRRRRHAVIAHWAIDTENGALSVEVPHVFPVDAPENSIANRPQLHGRQQV